MVFKFFSSKYKNKILHNRYIGCSCYKTQICYTNKNPDKIYACHCARCINDNNIYGECQTMDKPVIWVNIKNYEVHNEFTNEYITKIKWIRSSIFAKRGYCSSCNDILLIDYFFTQYIHDANITPKIDIFCYNKDKQLTDRHLNSWFEFYFYNLFFKWGQPHTLDGV